MDPRANAVVAAAGGLAAARSGAMRLKDTTYSETALTETAHRARNDLFTVAAMLRLHAAVSGDPKVSLALLDAEARVRALCNLNARMDAQAENVETTIASRVFFEGLADDLRATHFGHRPIALRVEAEPHRIAVAHTKPLGLIVNELVVNALKYTFPHGRCGTVAIRFRCPGADGHCVLTVRDDGVGFDLGAPPKGTGIGRRMVRALAAQAGGTFVFGSGADGVGTVCAVRWPDVCRQS